MGTTEEEEHKRQEERCRGASISDSESGDLGKGNAKPKVSIEEGFKLS